jgi:hypothetical protein
MIGWPLSLVVRTLGSQPRIRGSTPLGATRNRSPGETPFSRASCFRTRRTAASAASSGGAAGGASRRCAPAAFFRDAGDELLEVDGTARGAGDLLGCAHDELLEEPAAFSAFIFEYRHRDHFLVSASPLCSFFSDRSPIPHVGDIQVDTPRRGRRNLMTTIHTARNIRTLIIYLNRPFARVFGSGSGRARACRPSLFPVSICR